MVHHMPNRVIYVRKNDETFWERAEKRASHQGVSLSTYVSSLVRKDVIGVAGASSEVTESDLLDTLDRAVADLRKVVDNRAS